MDAIEQTLLDLDQHAGRRSEMHRSRSISSLGSMPRLLRRENEMILELTNLRLHTSANRGASLRANAGGLTAADRSVTHSHRAAPGGRFVWRVPVSCRIAPSDYADFDSPPGLGRASTPSFS